MYIHLGRPLWTMEPISQDSKDSDKYMETHLFWRAKSSFYSEQPKIIFPSSGLHLYLICLFIIFFYLLHVLFFLIKSPWRYLCNALYTVSIIKTNKQTNNPLKMNDRKPDRIYVYVYACARTCAHTHACIHVCNCMGIYGKIGACI